MKPDIPKSMDILMYERLTNCPLFKGLTSDELQNSLSKVHFQLKKYDKNVVIAQSGEECNQMVLIAEGAVKGEMIDPSGKTVKIEEIEAPGTAASAFVFGRDNYFPVNVVTTKPAKILFIDKHELLKLYQINETILHNYLNIISNRTQFLAQKIRFLTFKSIKGKLASYLLKRAQQNLRSFELGKTQAELSELFGVARPSLARVLGEMVDEGIISIDKKVVTILNKEQLKACLKE